MTKLNDAIRLCLYSWLANVLTVELTETQIKAFRSETFSPMWQACDEIGLSEISEIIKHSLATLEGTQDADLELAADFAQLFLLDGDVSALPYASAYLPKKQHHDHFGQLESLFCDNQLTLASDIREPSDHIAVYLQLMTYAIKTQRQDMQKRVVDLLLAWIPDWVSKSEKISVKYAFYPAVLGLLKRVIIIDRDIIS
ncbi:molecular chaperone TorD [Pasteurellaceae bacterium 20609_3]|uniref:molecular chaperone TorD n=1 Tax=Spirabiliibacterium mucosae TaxID=28156 RepID=UPI001AADCA13|nr:molecular chaperone TorD [Spirabiliibacterium mucosae]MBE2898163.1 molecular chaperone TorD [Spirabiliibacterium mucosae]